MDDIFKEWKTSKFIVADPALHGEAGQHLIIMTDFSYWSFYSDECIAWCYANDCKISGMTILIPSDQLLTAFLLKWQ